MPLLIRGPGVQAGTTTNKLTLNTDFFPTFTDLAGVTTPAYVDGRSLRPVLEGSATTWRTAILLELRINDLRHSHERRQEVHRVWGRLQGALRPQERR